MSKRDVCADTCAANLFFDIRDRISGVACRAAVAANLFFDRRMAASCAANLFSIGGVAAE